MTSPILAEYVLGAGLPGMMEWIVLIITFVLTVLPLALIIYIVLLLVRNKKENQRLRLEVAKLADELEHIRKQ